MSSANGNLARQRERKMIGNVSPLLGIDLQPTSIPNEHFINVEI